LSKDFIAATKGTDGASTGGDGAGTGGRDKEKVKGCDGAKGTGETGGRSNWISSWGYMRN